MLPTGILKMRSRRTTCIQKINQPHTPTSLSYCKLLLTKLSYTHIILPHYIQITAAHPFIRWLHIFHLIKAKVLVATLKILHKSATLYLNILLILLTCHHQRKIFFALFLFLENASLLQRKWLWAFTESRTGFW